MARLDTAAPVGVCRDLIFDRADRICLLNWLGNNIRTGCGSADVEGNMAMCRERKDNMRRECLLNVLEQGRMGMEMEKKSLRNRGREQKGGVDGQMAQPTIGRNQLQ